MYFIDEEHENFYKIKIRMDTAKDVYINSLIYLLSSNKETREHFDDIYDIMENEINMESLKTSWQTSTSLNTCRLAFNLFGGITADGSEEDNSYLYTVIQIFKSLDMNCGLQAIMLRFGC